LNKRLGLDGLEKSKMFCLCGESNLLQTVEPYI
jgi:hypothetical protein